MTDPLISVVIDTFNYGLFIEQAIDSVLSQHYPIGRIQVVVIDDGSTDDTVKRMGKYSDRIEYRCKVNKGQASALNLGFKYAFGEIVALLDADDYWYPTKLRRIQEEFARDEEIGFVSHPLYEVDPTTGAGRDTHFGAVSGYLPDSLPALLSYRVSPTSALAFRRPVLERILPIPEQFRLQADLYLGLLGVFLTKTSAIQETLGVHRLHGRNLYSRSGSCQTTEEAIKHLTTRRQIISAAHGWLAAHGFDGSRPDIDLFFRQLLIFLASDEFLIKPPGRIRLFEHLLECNRVYGAMGNWKLRMLNYAKACAILALGTRR
jgi:glycosyltransferase involved in cell wall biosynthesis